MPPGGSRSQGYARAAAPLVIWLQRLLYRVMAGPSSLFVNGYDESWNSRAMRAVELPSSNGIGDARSSIELSHRIRQAPISEPAPAEQLRVRVMPPA